MQMSLRYILIIAAVAMLFESCMATLHPGSEKNKDPQPKAGRVLAAQLIIKFKDAKTDPTQANFLKQLSRDAHAILHYLRPMSGGAHVFHVSSADEKELAVIIRRLSRRADIEYVEEDSIMVHQQKEK